ncbi:alpha-amylase family glycosyl hydrolase [Microbulbifer taiwanensis]|uniref:Alpha-amylase family glycosyl hydrolase n=1 Tax=Microbulbifer taiwanensis TaxID=986746 RepID=A0ABW1YKF1_9GAMM|nr:alpha-amylase family glycosyl hydrolase [Microbulbifer taiwanensis]
MRESLFGGRSRLLAVPCLLIAGYSSGAAAEWFFRGTPNNWSATALESAGGTEYTTCQSFASGGDPRFKIDRYADWAESYPAADFAVTGNKSYEITFDSGSHSISVSEVASCDGGSGGFASNFPSLYFRGTPNGWGSSSMQLVADNIWELTVAFDGQPDQRYKLDLYGDWSQDYGDNNGDGVLEAGGGDIPASVSGTYLLRVDDSDLSYELVGESNGGGTDSWYFRGTANGWAATEMSSSDGINFCTEQSFASGDAGGGPRFKIDHHGDWVESYPTADYSVNANTDYEICFDADSHDITATAVGTPPPPPPVGEGSDFRSETIYFLLTARFYDGDQSNNYYNRDRIMPGDPHWRGDFKGLIEKLDYIVDLGFSAIWITPPVENRSGLDYHGYHAYDWTRVDPRLESPGATYQDFIDAAHARGLKVIQDVVVNHSSQYGIRDQVWIDHLPIKYYVPEGSSQGMISNNPYFDNLGDYQSTFRDDNDNPLAPQWFRDRHTSDPDGTEPLVDPKTGVTVPLAGYDPNRFFGIDAGNLDPAWYHLDGFMAGGDWENPTALQNKHMAGDTIDLATGNQNVKDYINGAIKQYLDMGVDAIRVDTVKHVERDELLSYVHEWQAHKPDLFVFGEALVFGLGFGSELGNDNASAVIRPWWFTRTGADPSNPQGDSDLAVIDFPLFSTFRDNVTRGSFGGVKGALDMDWTYADPTELVTFFQNHDVGPDNDFKYRFGGAEQDAALAYNLLWTIRGIPTLYYGEEIMFQAGLGQDIHSANDTIDQTGRAYFGPHLDDLATTQSHNLYRHIQRLNQIRHAVPALQKGQMEKVSEWGAGMSFVRNDSSGNSYAVVGLAAGSDQGISVSGVPNGSYTDVVTGAQLQVNNGSLTFTVKAYSAGIYVLNGSGKIGTDGAYLR